MLRGALLLWATLWGKGTSTVTRVTYYDNTSDCTIVEQITEYFGIPDAFGILDFDVCHGSSGSYVQYECNNSIVVYNMYTDADCTDAKDGTAAEAAFDDTCRGSQAADCDISDPDYSTYSSNFTVATMEFSDSSCTVWKGAFKYSMEGYVNPTTGSSDTCSPSELYDYNSKLVCVNGDLKTFYYENTDTACTSSPAAVVTTAPCLALGQGLYHLVSCEGAPIAEQDESPPLARDSTTTSTYTHFQTYSTAGCSVEETSTYYMGYPGYAYDLCLGYSGDGHLQLTCDSEQIFLSLFDSASCSSDSLISTSNLSSATSCVDEMRLSCTTTAPAYEGTTDEWEVSVASYDDILCVSSAGGEERYTWAQFSNVMPTDTSSESWSSDDSSDMLSSGPSNDACEDGYHPFSYTGEFTSEGSGSQWSSYNYTSSGISSSGNNTSSWLSSSDNNTSSWLSSSYNYTSSGPSSSYNYTSSGISSSYHYTSIGLSSSHNDTTTKFCDDGYSYDNTTDLWSSESEQSSTDDVSSDYYYYNSTGGHWCYVETYYNSTSGVWCGVSTGDDDGGWGASSGNFGDSTGGIFDYSSLLWFVGLSASCSPVYDIYNSMIVCVDETITLVLYSGMDTTCSDIPEMIYSVEPCTEFGDSYAKVSCVDVSSDSEPSDDDDSEPSDDDDSEPSDDDDSEPSDDDDGEPWDPSSASKAQPPCLYILISGAAAAAVGSLQVSGVLLWI